MARSLLDKHEVWKQYLFLRSEGDSYSKAVWKLSIHHGKHEQGIVRVLLEVEKEMEEKVLDTEVINN